MNSLIRQLWNKAQLPMKDAIYFRDGSAFSFKIIASPQPKIIAGKWFNLNQFLSESPADLTCINIIQELVLQNSASYLCVGGGGQRGEGFFAYFDINWALQWVVYAQGSNPFISARQNDDNRIIVDSSANFSLIFELQDPLNLRLYAT